MNKKLFVLSLMVVSLLVMVVPTVFADTVDIEVDHGTIYTGISIGDVTYESIVDPSKRIDLYHFVNVGESFVVVDEWDGYFGSINIETTFDSPSAYVGDDLFVAAISQNGTQVASSTYKQWEYGTNDLQLMRIVEYDVGYLGVTTEYNCNEAWWYGNSETELNVYAMSGDFLQEQIFTGRVGGVYEIDQWKIQRDMILDVEGAYSIDYTVIDLRGDDSGGSDYTFEFEASDGFLIWGGDATFVLDESYTSTEHGSGQWHTEDGIHIDMYYWGDSYPDVSFNAYGYNDLDLNILTFVDGDEVTVQGTADGN